MDESFPQPVSSPTPDVVATVAPGTEAVLGEFEIPTVSGPRPAPFPVVRELGLLVGVLVSVFLLPYAYTQARIETAARERARTAQVIATDTRLESPVAPAVANPDAFESLALLGKAAVVFDVATGEVLYSNNADETLPIASVTKLMTALVTYEMMPSLDVAVTIPKQHVSEEYTALQPGDTFTARNLLDYTLIVSSNEGALILADLVAKSALGTNATTDDFVRAMNIRAQSLGLTATTFRNPTGLDINATTAGAVSSARDIATLLAYITNTYPDLLAATTEPTKRFVGGNGFVYDAVNTNGVVRAIPGLRASKTGFETLAGGTLAVAFDAGLGRTIAVIVLGSTRNGRFEDVLQLVEATRKAL